MLLRELVEAKNLEIELSSRSFGRFALLDKLLVAYSYFPHHPGKGIIYERLTPLVQCTWKAPRKRTRFGVCFECDLNDKLTNLIYYIGLDRKNCRALRKLVKPGQVVIDAGAHVGYYSLLFAKWLHGEGRVHAFEPFPETARRFERNLELNPQSKPIVHLHRLALTDSTGTRRMRVPDSHNQGCNFLSNSGPTEVETITLDAFCEKEWLTQLDLIKIDVEGSEPALLRGAERTLKRFRPILVIECNERALRNFNSSAKDLLESIRSHQYELHYASRVGLRPFRGVPGYGEEPDLFAFPIQ